MLLACILKADVSIADKVILYVYVKKTEDVKVVGQISF